MKTPRYRIDGVMIDIKNIVENIARAKSEDRPRKEIQLMQQEYDRLLDLLHEEAHE